MALGLAGLLLVPDSPSTSRGTGNGAQLVRHVADEASNRDGSGRLEAVAGSTRSPVNAPRHDVTADESAGTVQLRVRVRDADGSLRPSARVECALLSEVVDPSERLRTTTTDGLGEGRFEIPPGHVRLSAWTDGATSGPERCEVRGAADLELTLSPASSVVGQVLDARTGMPVADAWLWVSSFQSSDRVRADDRGEFVLSPFPVDASVHFVHCEKPGYGFERVGLSLFPNQTWQVDSAARVGPPSTKARATLQRGFPARLDIRLQPARTVTGVVVDPAGAPVAGAWVRALGHVWIGSGLAGPDEASTRTDDAGVFELQPLRPDITHSIAVEAEALACARIFVPPSETQVVNLGVLRLQRPADVRVLVLAADGTPTEGAVLRLHEGAPTPEQQRALESSRQRFPRDADYDLPIEERVTDANGHVRFERAVVGAHRIDLRIDGARVLWRDLDVRPGVAPEAVVLELPESFVTWRGVVTKEGAGVPDAVVQVVGAESRQAVCGPNGAFVLAGIDPSRDYSVQANWFDSAGKLWTSSRLEVDAGALGELRLELVPADS